MATRTPKLETKVPSSALMRIFSDISLVSAKAIAFGGVFGRSSAMYLA